MLTKEERRKKTIEWFKRCLANARVIYGEDSEQARICKEQIAELSKPQDN